MKNRFIVVTLLIVSLFFFAFSCGKKKDTQEEEKKTPVFNLNETTLTINVDDEHKIDYSSQYIDTFSFKSSDTKVVSVDNNGNVKALKEGEATISITAGEFTGSVSVTVVENRKVKITYKSNVASVKIDAEEIKYGTGVTFKAAPEVTYYDFLGYAESETATTYISSLDRVKEDTTVYALYKIQQHTLTYVLDGGTYDQKSGAVDAGTKVTLGTPTKTGYDFLGWGTTATAKTYVTEVTMTEDTTVYAIFKIKTFKVNFNLDGGTYDAAVKSANYGTVITLTAATKSGYDFLGWSTEKGSTTYVTEITVTDTVNLYANFEEHRCQVTYVLNDGVCAAATNQKVLADTVIDLDKLVPTKDHYTFLGWTKAETSTAYVSGKQTITEDVTYYAQYQIDSYTISYELDGGTLYSSVKSVDYNGSVTLSTPVKAGFKFVGWSLTQGGTTYVTELTNVKADQKVYANWTAQTYTISYNLYDGVLTSKKETITADETYTLPTPTKAGVTFLGWTTTKYGTAYVTELKNISANVTLFAHYTDGLVADATNAQTVIDGATAGAKITLLPGTYTTLTIAKAITLCGPNAGVDPVNSTRGSEAVFTGLIEVTTDDVTIDGIALEGKGQIYANGTKNTSILNLYSYDAALNDNEVGTVYEGPILATSTTNLVIKYAYFKTTTVTTTHRNTILYGYNIDGLDIEYCSFNADKKNLNDGIKIDNGKSNSSLTGAYSFGIKGTVTIAHNYFNGYNQYTIWLKDYGAGTYSFIDNVVEDCGNYGDGNRGLVTFKSCSTSEPVTVDFSYNTIKESASGIRLDAGGSNVSFTIKYNKFIDTNEKDLQFAVSTVNTVVSNNYFSADAKLNNCTATDSYATEEEVPTYSSMNSQTYNITYELDGGEWPASYYTAEEIGEQFFADLKAATSHTTTMLDTSYMESSWFGDMMDNNTYKTKWMWLLQAIYDLAGNGDSSVAPTNTFTGNGTMKGFYMANMCGFFTSTNHKDSNFGTQGLDYSDPDTGKPIILASTPKGVEAGTATYKTNVTTELSVPSKDGYAFIGWMTQDGQVITSVSPSMTGDLTLTALWEEAVIADGVVITNIPEKGIKLYSSLQLEWNVTPSNAYNKNVSFYSMDSSIFSVTDKGVIKATGLGTGKLRIKLEGNPDYVEYVDIVIWSGEYFDVSYETNSYVGIGDDIVLNAAYIDSNSKVLKVKWESLNADIATVDEGVVSGVKAGNATIRVTVINNPELTFDFYVTVLPEELSDTMEYVIENHYSNAFTRYNLGIGAGTPEYYYDVVWSVNNILFNDELKIDRRYYDKLPAGTKNNGVMDSVEFIVVHYTGNMKSTADADNNCDYFNELSYAASIHYVTGRTNLTDLTGLSSGYSQDAYYAFAGLNELYGGWHASTGQNKCIWDATGVSYKSTDPETPVISISDNYKYTINGVETTITIPTVPSGYSVHGSTMTVGGKEYSVFNSYGLMTKVEGGKYYLARTYWGQQSNPQTLCTYGGNTNAIGIESCVDKGSDLLHTWHVTAQLVANIMYRYDLGIERVVGHHFFSGKNCPQPLLENDMELWYLFIDMVEAEYALLTTYKDATISAKAKNTAGILRDNGLLVQDADAHCVTYDVTVTVGGKTETITLATCVESYFKCTCNRTEESLQLAGYPVI